MNTRLQRIAYDLRANATVHRGLTAWHCSIPADEVIELVHALSHPEPSAAQLDAARADNLRRTIQPITDPAIGAALAMADITQELREPSAARPDGWRGRKIQHAPNAYRNAGDPPTTNVSETSSSSTVPGSGGMPEDSFGALLAAYATSLRDAERLMVARDHANEEDAERIRATLKAERSRCDDLRSQLFVDRSRLVEALEEHKEYRSNINAQYDKLAKENVALRSTLEEARQAVRERNVELRINDGNIAALRRALDQKEKELEATKAQLEKTQAFAREAARQAMEYGDKLSSPSPQET